MSQSQCAYIMLN